MSLVPPPGQESLEAAVFESMIRAAGKHGSALRVQFENSVMTREITPSGFYLTFEQPKKTVELIPLSMLDADAVARGQGLETQAEFILKFKDGLIAELEGFAYSDWPSNVQGLTLVSLAEEYAK